MRIPKGFKLLGPQSILQPGDKWKSEQDGNQQGQWKPVILLVNSRVGDWPILAIRRKIVTTKVKKPATLPTDET